MMHILYVQPFIYVPEHAYMEGMLGIYELANVDLPHDVFV